MKWSWKLGEFARIGVYVHATFLLLMGWVAVARLAQGDSLVAAARDVLFLLALFGCVVMHEFGHALTARRYGIKTRDITLLPIGGVARLERMPEHPRQELWVALAGPAVNVLIAAALWFALQLTQSFETRVGLSWTGGSWWQRLMAVNVSLALFNLLPAFPMDGGRVLRALLATRMEYTRATQVAASLGQGAALLLGLAGLLWNPFLIFIAMFVWIGAEQEASMVQIKSALSGIPVAQAMITDFQTLSPRDPLDRAVELILRGWQQDFPVLEGDRVRGILTRGDLLAALAERRSAAVGDVMRPDFQVVDYSEMLETAFRRLQDCGCRAFPVIHNGRLAGLLTPDNVGEFLMIQAALEGQKGARIMHKFE